VTDAVPAPSHADNPIGTELVFEDERVRIWRIDLAPGEVAAMHTHMLDYTTVTVEGDAVERLNDDGSVDLVPVTPGSYMRWHQGSLRHGLRNVGPGRFRNVIVEIKAVPIP
jgi:glyoxylate utilization-related uncharacterized protein